MKEIKKGDWIEVKVNNNDRFFGCKLVGFTETGIDIWDQEGKADIWWKDIDVIKKQDD